MRRRRQSREEATEEEGHLSKTGNQHNALLALSAPKSSIPKRGPEEAAGRRYRVNDIASEQLVSELFQFPIAVVVAVAVVVVDGSIVLSGKATCFNLCSVLID